MPRLTWDNKRMLLPFSLCVCVWYWSKYGFQSNDAVSFDFNVLTGPETAWTRWWVRRQTSGRQQDRGVRGSPCETKQSTSCSVKPGRSFWLQFCLDRPQRSRDMERAARGNATHARTHACMLTHTYMHMYKVALFAQWWLVLDVSDIGSRWRDISTHWQKEIMRENVPYSHKLFQILRLPMTDNLNLGANGH